MIHASLKQLSAALAEKRVSAVELAGLFLDRIDALNPALNAFVTNDRDQTLAMARAADERLARGETGGLLALAYSSMRGYGNIHPTLGELRVGYLPLTTRHPVSGKPYVIGEVKVTEAEVLARMEGNDGMPKFSLGYGFCFGQNEIKAISMAILDRSTRTKDPKSPAEDQEFVLYHTDGIEAMGFCNHWKLPHYVDFLSDLDRLRKSQENARAVNRKEGSNGVE